jgi:hypothetical protein
MATFGPALALAGVDKQEIGGPGKTDMVAEYPF